MTPCARFSIALFACVLPALAGAQVFRCADSAGKVQYSDRACDAGQKSSEVRIHASPAPVLRMSAGAAAYEQTRQQRKDSSDESHRRVDEATVKVRQIKDENHDPRKCAEVRERITRMERGDPLMYKFDPVYSDFQQKASLYCGN